MSVNNLKKKIQFENSDSILNFKKSTELAKLLHQECVNKLKK